MSSKELLRPSQGFRHTVNVALRDAGVVELWGEGGYHLKIWQVQDTNKIFLPGIIQLKSDKSDTFTLKVS